MSNSAVEGQEAFRWGIDGWVREQGPCYWVRDLRAREGERCPRPNDWLGNCASGPNDSLVRGHVMAGSWHPSGWMLGLSEYRVARGGQQAW